MNFRVISEMLFYAPSLHVDVQVYMLIDSYTSWAVRQLSWFTSHRQAYFLSSEAKE